MPAPSMPNLNVESSVFGTRISWNIMAQTAVLPPSATSTVPSGKDLLADVRDVRRIHRHRHVGELLVELRAFAADGLAILRDLAAARIEIRARAAAFRVPVASAARNSFASASTARVAGLLAPRMWPSMSTWIIFCSDGCRQYGALPHQSVSPSREPTHQHDVGIVAHLVVELDVAPSASRAPTSRAARRDRPSSS